MREFVFGTDIQYDMLKDSLNDNLCHVYPNCTFPKCFSVAKGRIGFEKEGNTYALFIDKGIRCHRPDVSQDLKDWLSCGTLRFLNFTGVKVFMRSLESLY